jgi:RNA polymerase sigma-70 factor (ECF subfamily)
MLGSLSEADDAVQDAWLRLSRHETDEVHNLGAWLTTVVARVCLNQLASRRTRAEQPLEARLPDPVISPESGLDPEHEALLADAVGIALLVVLDSLAPAERLAFVLHDMFGVPFEEIAPMIDRSPAAARQLASRARRRVQGQTPVADPDLGRQRAVVDAFYAAARDGDFEALVAVLDPDVVLRADGGGARNRPTVVLRGARTVAAQAAIAKRLATQVRPILVNGLAGVLAVVGGKPFSIMSFVVADGRITAIEVFYDPKRLAELDLTALDRRLPVLPPADHHEDEAAQGEGEQQRD